MSNPITAWYEAIPILGDIVKAAIGIWSKSVTDKDELNKRAGELATALIPVLAQQQDLLKTDALSEDKIQRRWRPILMLIIGGVIALLVVVYGVVFPVLNELYAWQLQCLSPLELLATLGGLAGVNVAGRSVEKTVDTLKNGRRV